MLSYVSGNCRYRLSRVPIHKPFVSHSRAQSVDVRVAVVDEHFVQFFVERVLLGSGVPENGLDFHLFHIKIFEFFVTALFLLVI